LTFPQNRPPDATTFLYFRHLLEKHDITRKIFDDVKQRLDASELIMHGGTIVDATIIHAPRSTKNVTSPAILRCTPRRRGISGTSA
jgi:hypothetical protein